MRPSTAAVRGCLFATPANSDNPYGAILPGGARAQLNRPGACGASDPADPGGVSPFGELCFVDGDRRAYSHWASRSGGPQST